MPGVSVVGPTPFLSAHDCGVSMKLNHSNSIPHIGITPSFSARFSTRFSTCRGQIPSGTSLPFFCWTNSPRKKGTPSSHGTWRSVPRSIFASASGNPLCQPVSDVLSYVTSIMSQPNTTSQKPKPPSAAE